MAEPTSDTVPVNDHRVRPRGVLPRGAQTWLMVALALGVLGIIAITGQPTPSPRSAAAPADSAPPNADRLRDYQDRLRALDERSREQALAQGVSPAAPLLYENAAASSPADPLASEKQRREYESLFAGNVVVSLRDPSQRPVSSTSTSTVAPSPLSNGGPSTPPTLDEVVDAVMRATVRFPGSEPLPPPQTPPAEGGGAAASRPPGNVRATPATTGPISAAGPLHPLLEGTVLDTVLTNRLDGGANSPVNCLVTNPVYSHSGQQVLIPAGSRVLGETKPVQALGETRLAVAFHRLLFPDGRTYALNQFAGLNQIGDAGLRDQVNQHYLSTFGASAAVGLITGFSQFLGSAGLGGGDGNRTIVIAGGVGDATSQATAQVMNRLSNRLPTVTIREGHRVKVYLTSDLALPAYDSIAPSRTP